MQPDPSRPPDPPAPAAASPTKASRRTAKPAVLPERVLTAAGLLALVVLVALGALAYGSTLQTKASALAVQRSQRALTALARLRAVVAEAEAALQGAPPAASPEALAPYRLAKDESEAQLTELRSALAADSDQFDRLVALGALLSQRFDALAATLQAPQRKGAEPQRTADASDDTRLHERVQAALAELRQHAQDRLGTDQARRDASVTRTLVAIAVDSALAVGLVGFVGWRVQRDRAQASRAEALQTAAERNQRRSDLALQRVFDASFDALCVIDAEGRLARAGAACERVWGWSADAIGGKPYLDLVHPEDRRKTEQALAAAPAGPTCAEFRGRCRHRDGHSIDVLWRAQALGDDGRLLCLVRDVSEAERLRAEGSRLDAALTRCRAELAQAQAQAAATARLRSEFMSHVGAGLRSSPAAIVSLGEILQQGLAGPLNAEQQRELAKLLDTARSLRGRINALLDLALIDGRQLELAREPFDLLESVQKVAGNLRGAAEKKSLGWDCRLAEDLGYARGDVARVEQLLSALLDHAIRSTAAGKVTLQALSPSGGVIRIAITDSGPGFPPEEAAQLFDPFRAGGAGLGLALAQQLARLMGGDVDASIAPGGGSTFTLTLPADDVRPA